MTLNYTKRVRTCTYYGGWCIIMRYGTRNTCHAVHSKYSNGSNFDLYHGVNMSKLEGSMGQCELVVLNGPNHWPSLGAYRERSALYALWTVYGLYGVTGRKTKVSVLCIACRRYEQIQLPYAVHVQPGDMSIMCMCCTCMIVYALCDCTI